MAGTGYTLSHKKKIMFIYKKNKIYILIIDLMVINDGKWCKWLTGEKVVNTELHNSQIKDKF